MNTTTHHVSRLLLCGLLATGLFAAGARASSDKDEIALLRKTSRAFAAVAKNATPAVVFIRVESSLNTTAMGNDYNDPFNPFGDEFLGRLFGIPTPQNSPQSRFKKVGQGSGFLISKDGYILTNNHVVGDADKITVRLHDGREFDAKLVGTDPKSEVAVIKIEGDDFPFATLGDSSRLEIGEWVVAIGNPFGLAESVTAGIVSAKGRSGLNIADYENFIQTDAAINPGNSGGPLLNIDSEVVGINTAIFSQNGSSTGIGFAIPINIAKEIKDQLVATGHIQRGYLGVRFNREEMNEDMARSFGLDRVTGVLVAEVLPGSPAEKAELKDGDIILSIDGELIQNTFDLQSRIKTLAPGTEVSMRLFRDGREQDVKVTLGAFAEENPSAQGSASGLLQRLGFAVGEVTPELGQKFGYRPGEGVLVTDVDPQSMAAWKGIRPGVLITGVNRQAIENLTEFTEALDLSGKTGKVLLRFRDGMVARYVVLALGQP